MSRPFRHFALGMLSALVLVTAVPAESVAGPRHGRHRHNGNWEAPAVAAAVIGGLALGALAASAYPYGPGYPGGCAIRRQATYDAWGQFIGYRRVQYCD